MTQYILDTSALITYIENEEGNDQIESLLLQALEQQIRLLISVVSTIEVFYISLQEQGQEVALERLKLIQTLPLEQVDVDSSFIQIIGELKATKSLSFADCCIAGLAKSVDAILIHKDPEFEQIEDEVQQLKLPYKHKSGKVK